MGANVNKTQCKKCLYRADGDWQSVHACDYAPLTGEVRKCEPSPDCIKFEEYDREKRKKLRDESSRRNNQKSLCRKRREFFK